MPDVHSSGGSVTVRVNDERVEVPRSAMLITALLKAGAACRVSVSGEERTALCGMGICFECRARVDGVPQQRTCQIVCRDGMTVDTQR